MLTIVAYHYVRDLPRTRYPKFNGLLTKYFEGQLDYIGKHYTVCSAQEVASAVRGEGELPDNPCLLTFDDGFLDHYMTVFPRLVERGMTGSFFPVVQAVEENKLLNTHKLHFILSSESDHRKVIDDIFRVVGPYRKDHDIPDDEELYKTYTNPPSPDGDPTETVFIKRIQHILPSEVRTSVMDELFQRYVQDDEETLAAETYMDMDQLRHMASQGMEVGGHGNSHVWLTQLTDAQQKKEQVMNRYRSTASYTSQLPSDQVLVKLTKILGAANIQADPAKNEHYRMGWRSGGGSALAVLFPQTLFEIWQCLEVCVEGNCIIIMQAAKTGLTEGSTPSGDDYDRPVVVINTLAINKLYLINDNEQ